MTTINHLSSSQIRLYLQCGLKYRYQYIDNLPRLFRPAALAFGSALHSALSFLHTARINGNTISLEKLIKVYETDWYSQTVETDLHYKDGEGADKLLPLGREMLGLYYHHPHKQVKGSEVPFVVPLVNPATGETLDVTLEGFFDLIEVNDIIVEFKTSAQAITQSDAESHLQLTAYGYAYQFVYGKPAKGFKLVNFIKGKRPRIETLDTTREKHHYEMFFSIANQVLRAIRSGIFIPCSGFWCKECEYRDLCPIWNPTEASSVEKLEYVHAHK